MLCCSVSAVTKILEQEGALETDWWMWAAVPYALWQAKGYACELATWEHLLFYESPGKIRISTIVVSPWEIFNKK